MAHTCGWWLVRRVKSVEPAIRTSTVPCRGASGEKGTGRQRWRRARQTERMGRAGTNAIQYQIAALSKFMTIYTHCMPDAVGVRVALTASRSAYGHILITSLALSVLLRLSAHMRTLRPIRSNFFPLFHFTTFNNFQTSAPGSNQRFSTFPSKFRARPYLWFSSRDQAIFLVIYVS